MIGKIFRVVKEYWVLIGAFIVSFIMFFPSLFSFYTNDDFFFLKIARVSSFRDFLNFFNLAKDVAGIGVYRPLTLRVYYFLTVEFFHLSPTPLHIISFITFFADIFLVYQLVNLLTKGRKIALISSFLYATSVTHFGRLYYIGAFQELFLTLTFLLSVIFFIKYEVGVGKKNSINNLLISFVFFILALMSKETAVVLPFVIIVTHIFLRQSKMVRISARKMVYSLSPFLGTLGIYLFLHFRYFGLVGGDSYIWDFSPMRAINTSVWYFLWSLNLPEMLVDFVGPGIRLNPNLLKYWSNFIIPIFILFAVQTALSLYALIRSKFSRQTIELWLFHISWFILTLLPVAFLPLHKFTYYLTLPLFAIVLLLAYLFSKRKPVTQVLFCAIWVTLSVLALRLTIGTNWITQGEGISERVYQYFEKNQSSLDSKNIVFTDKPEDKNLPWSPTATLKTVLSGNNFFEVFFPNLSQHISYSGKGEIVIRSRQFLGY